MKQKISIAANQPKPKDLSRTHFTTLGFGQMFPIFAEEVVNKDKFRMSFRTFARAGAMKLPNMSDLKIKLHGFYVPFRYVWDHFENFKEGLPSWNSKGSQVYKSAPFITTYELTNFFLKEYDDDYVVAGTQTDFDIRYLYYDHVQDQPDQYRYYKFTLKGKIAYHIFTALGYRWNWVDYDSAHQTDGLEGDALLEFDKRNFKCLSLLPFLCFCKIYLDYFIPSQLQPSSRINQLYSEMHDLSAATCNLALLEDQYDETLIHDGEARTPYWYIGDFLNALLEELCFYYPNNYFTSAWQTPNEVVQGLQNIGTTTFDMPVINSIGNQKSDESLNYNSVRNQPLLNDDSGVINYNVDVYDLSSDGLSFLQKFARFVKRSNYAGSRSVERLLARFGVRVDDFNLGMCRYLGEDSVDIEISDVTVTGNTSEAGDLAGKSWAAGNGHRVFKCDCDLAGYIIFTAHVDVPSTFTHGLRRRMFHLQPLDYYTPEIDGGQMQLISLAELYYDDKFGVLSNSEKSLLNINPCDGFGYTPRYSEYKHSLPEVTGDFDIPRLASSIDPFILPRRILDTDKLFQLLRLNQRPTERQLLECFYSRPQSAIAAINGDDAYQFNRIFKDTTGFVDPFVVSFDINCVVNSVTIPLNESAEMIGRGKVLEFETNGKHI